MTATETRSQVLVARIVVILAVGFIALGLVWYGVSIDVNQRFWSDIAARPGGPMTFRFILQPCMATIAAFHDAVADARSGAPPYLQAIVTDSAGRARRLHEGLIATGRIILLGICMDAIYQLTVLKTFYPGEMVAIAFLLAFVPYLLLRGPIERVARRWSSHGPSHPPA